MMTFTLLRLLFPRMYFEILLTSYPKMEKKEWKMHIPEI